MKRKTDLSYWPTFLHPFFVALGTAMDGKQLHPNVLENLPPIDSDFASDHKWHFVHLSGEAAKPGPNRYEIEIAGPRIQGKWAFRSGELANIAREAVSTRS